MNSLQRYQTLGSEVTLYSLTVDFFSVKADLPMYLFHL